MQLLRSPARWFVLAVIAFWPGVAGRRIAIARSGRYSATSWG